MEKMIRDGKVAVLISGGYGAGWSTWAAEEAHREALAMDTRLVRAFMDGVSEEGLPNILGEIFGDGFHQYPSGWRGVRVEWVTQGTRFVIREYDGSESLLLISEETTMLA